MPIFQPAKTSNGVDTMIFFSGIKGHGNVQINLLLLLAACLLTIPSLSQARDVSFVWEPNQESISGYKLYYKTGDSSAEPFDGTGIVEGASPIVVGDVTSFTVTDLADDQTYQFALTAFNEFGESGYSTVVTISPGEPTLRSVDFTWNPNPDPVTGYKLYYKTGDTPDAPFTGTGLEQGDSPIVRSHLSVRFDRLQRQWRERFFRYCDHQLHPRSGHSQYKPSMNSTVRTFGYHSLDLQ